MTDSHYPIRCIAKWNMSEFDPRAPRNQKINYGKDEKYYL